MTVADKGADTLPLVSTEAGTWLRRAPERSELDDLEFRAMYRKEDIEVTTGDDWTLVLTRYKPRRLQNAKRDDQPLWEEPILLVHGFSQNRHAWTSGDFVKRLLWLGMDVFLLELRGHGKSSCALQRKKHRNEGRPLPADIDYGWDFADYMIHDVPAAIEAVKRATGRDSIHYCGHSMGGLLGYATAARRNDLVSLTTVGSPIHVASESLPLQVLSHAEPLITATQAAVRGVERIRRTVAANTGRFHRRLLHQAAPIDVLLGSWYRSIALAHEVVPTLLPSAMRLSNPKRADFDKVSYLLAQPDKEPVAVVRTFMRWIRRKELVCYRTGFDIRKALETDVTLPLLICYGDDDTLAGTRSTRPAYVKAASDYRIYQRLRDNSHVDITMGHDTGIIVSQLERLVRHALGVKLG